MSSPELLRSFIAAADTGSFSAAGRTLGRHQATISGNIARLEDELAVVLFDRDGKYPSLTQEGLALYDSAKLVVESSERFAQNALNLSTGIPTLINIAIDEDLPISPFTRVIQSLRKAYPLLKVNLLRRSTTDIIQLVKDEQVDMALTAAVEGRSNFYEFNTIGSVTYHFVCGRRHPFSRKNKITTDELMHSTQLLQHSVIGTDRAQTATLSYHTWGVQGYEALLSALKANVGWAFIPSLKGQSLPEELVVLNAEYANDDLTMLYDAIWPKNRAQSEVEQFILQELIDLMKG